MAGTDGDFTIAKLRAKIDANQPVDHTDDVANGRHADIARSFNAQSGSDVDLEHVPIDDVLQATADSDVADLVENGTKDAASKADKAKLWQWEQILVSAAATEGRISAAKLKAKVQTIWAGTGTLAALNALTEVPGTHAEVYWGQGFQVSHQQVSQALRL
jgi:hypothetical protein